LFAGVSANANFITLVAAVVLVGMLLTVYATLLHIHMMRIAALTVFNGTALLLLLHIAQMPYEMIGNTLAWAGMGFAVTALGIRFGCARLLSSPFTCPRWTIWWLRPLLGTAHLFSVIGFSVLMIANAYKASPSIQAANIVLLTVYFALVYTRSRQ